MNKEIFHRVILSTFLPITFLRRMKKFALTVFKGNDLLYNLSICKCKTLLQFAKLLCFNPVFENFSISTRTPFELKRQFLD